MKKLKIILGMAILFVFAMSCEKETTILVDNPEMNVLSESELEKTEIFNNWLLENKDSNTKNSLSARSEFSYQGELTCGTSDNIVFTGYRTINNPQDWDYYYFDGEVGDIISIQVQRTAPAMDVGLTLYFGSITDFEAIGRTFGSPNLEYLVNRDDQVDDDFDSCYNDPLLENYTLPYTGRYTMVVWDWLSCGPGDMSYTIDFRGNVYDFDCDGILNEDDQHPNSIRSDELSFDGCYPGVSNQFSAPGTTMMDEINDVIAGVWAIMNSPNKRRNFDPQRQFQSDMSNLLNSWYRRYDALVTDAQKFEITKCVRRSRIFQAPN